MSEADRTGQTSVPGEGWRTGRITASALSLSAVVLLVVVLGGCCEDSTAPPALALAPASIQLAPEDSVASFEIRNAGTGRLTWELSDDAPWLAPRADHGTTESSTTLTMALERDSLAVGPTTATVSVASNGGNGAVLVHMWRALETRPLELDLGDAEIGTLEIRNLGAEPLLWRTVPIEPWLSAAPQTGVLPTAAEPETLTVTVEPSGLASGEHSGVLVVSAGALGCDSVRVAILVPSTATVSGHIYYAATHIPIPEVIVTIGAIADTTDDAGAYRLEAVPAGQRQVTAARVGFEAAQAELTVLAAGTTWDAWLTSSVHTLTLRGVVRNRIGSGVYPVVATLLNPDGSAADVSTITAEDGSYTLAGVPEGRREIQWENYYYEVLVSEAEVWPTSTNHDVQLVARPVPPPIPYDNEHHVHLERVGCHGVQVVWRPRYEATAAGYHVERAVSVDGPFTEISGLVAAPADRFVDLVPMLGRYAYRVRTENIDGVMGAATNPERDQIAIDIWAGLNDGTAYGDSLHRYGQVTAYDSQFKRMIMFGGVGCEGGHCGDDFNDTWALDLDSYRWRLLDPGSGPGKRQSHVGIYDEVRQRLVIFGGVNLSNGTHYRDTWAYDLSGESGGSWICLEEGSQAPGTRYEHVGIYTGPADDRLLIYAGKNLDTGEVYNDVWAFDLASHTWERILEGYYGEQDPQPLGRYGHSAVYDPLRQRLIFYGGQRTSSILYADTWALDLITYTWLLLGDGPGPRYAHACAYDPLGDRLLLYGGRALGDAIFGDLRALALGGDPYWVEISLDNEEGPGLRYNHSLIFDASDNRLVLFAGMKPRATPELRPDTWAYCFER